MTHSIFDRRTVLRLGLGAAAAGLFGATGRVAFADAISSAKIEGSSDMAKGVQKSGKLRIGFSNGFSGNTWRTECLTSMQSEAKANADKYEFIMVDGQGDISKQVNDIEDLISQNVDAILCIPNSGTAVVPALRKATKAGIVTVPFNLPVEGENYTAFIGTDPKRKGATTGKALNGFLGGKGKIVALGGLPGNSYTAECWAGAKSQFAPGIEVLTFKDASWEEDKAKVVMADLIAAYPEIDGIWCDGAQDAAGALKALIAANRPLRARDGRRLQRPVQALRRAEGQEPRVQDRLRVRALLGGRGRAPDRRQAAVRPGCAETPDHRPDPDRRQQLPAVHEEGPAGRRLRRHAADR